jgi:RHS repeat-associated protein
LGHGGYSFRDYGYNQAGRPWLESVVVNGIVTSSYTYDANGNHESSVLGWSNLGANQDTSLPFAGDNVPEFIDLLTNGSVVRRLRLIKNQVGTVGLVADVATGEIVQRLEHDDFGRVLSDTNSGFQPFGFAGGLHDGDTGLVRFGARDYDPTSGRWKARDPVRFAGGLNSYVFADSAPTAFLDVAGLMSSEEFQRTRGLKGRACGWARTATFAWECSMVCGPFGPVGAAICGTVCSLAMYGLDQSNPCPPEDKPDDGSEDGECGVTMCCN